MKELLELSLIFAKIGSVNFGGGYAMLPLLERELVTDRGWVTTDELMDYFAIGQCTPGIIALNVSTFIGNKRKGIAGGITASIGFLTVPIVIILLIAAFLTNFASLPVVKNAFAGIRVCVCVLILQAVERLWNKAIVDKRTLILYLVIFALAAFSLILYLVIFALAAFSAYLPVSLPAAVLVIGAGVFGVFFGKAGGSK